MKMNSKMDVFAQEMLLLSPTSLYFDAATFVKPNNFKRAPLEATFVPPSKKNLFSGGKLKGVPKLLSAIITWK